LTVTNKSGRVIAELTLLIMLSCSLDWYIENNGTATWPIDLQADQLAQRLAPQSVKTAFGPGMKQCIGTSTVDKCWDGFAY